MARPWQRIVVEEDHGVVELHADGRMMPGLNVAMSTEDVEATRQGYKCINCFENLDSAWPATCPVCGYPIASHQAEQFAQVYKGYDPTLRTGANWEAEADRLQEREERRRTAARAKESGIWLGSKRAAAALDRLKGAS